jgi:hypothetical protein
MSIQINSYDYVDLKQFPNLRAEGEEKLHISRQKGICRHHNLSSYQISTAFLMVLKEL